MAFTNEVSDTCVSARERRLVRQEDNAEMTCLRRLPKPATVHHKNLLFDQQVAHEVLIALRDFQPRKGVESPPRLHAAYPWSSVAPIHGEVAARAQFPPHLLKMVLQALQRRPHRVLLRMVRAKPRPQQLVDSLDVR